MTETVKGRSAVTFILVFFVVLTIVGLVCGAYVVRDYAKGRASLAWPATDAVVLNEVRGEGFHYAYSFAGKTYQSSRKSVFTAQLKHRTDTVFQPGETVTVFVNPQNPSYAVLYPGGSGAVFFVLCIICGLCVFVGLGGVVWTFSDGVGELTDGELLQA